MQELSLGTANLAMCVEMLLWAGSPRSCRVLLAVGGVRGRVTLYAGVCHDDQWRWQVRDSAAGL